ncbi:MAG: hypothetical protein K2W85_07950 [Phycisphaerales bacterium]|nr:hypothetical protein [Phycisphaerales bacterium]
MAKPSPASTTAVAASETAKTSYAPPRGVERALPLPGGGRTRTLRASADWILVREHGIPAAEVFFTAYQLERSGGAKSAQRPVMFLFNGGPGAASAFLHLGTAGPMRVGFHSDGRSLPPPVRMEQNHEHWLDFADLVFIDPVGTGFSRTVHEARLEQQGLDVDEEKREKRTKDLPGVTKTFFTIKRDIEVLCECVSAWLSRFNRWESPVYIAGESYGGFRVGKLMRALPERGVGLTGAIMVSPAIDFLSINGTDYDAATWFTSVPSMALSAAVHGKTRGRFARMKPAELATTAESFAIDELAPLLLHGDRAPAARRDRTLGTLAELIGLSAEFVRRSGGRIKIDQFVRELLREEGRVCGYYDAAITGPNVFPDREGDASPDPTLAGVMSAFTAGANALLRGTLGISTSREYVLVNDQAWKSWVDDRADGYWARQLDCADDMRYGLAMNPSLRLLIAHGRYDLVTTYFASAQTVATTRLPEELRKNVELTVYDGGHMFYTWDRSRKLVQDDVGRLVRGMSR